MHAVAGGASDCVHHCEGGRENLCGVADETQKLHQARELAMLTRDLLIDAEQSVVSSLKHQMLPAKEQIKRKNTQHKTIA